MKLSAILATLDDHPDENLPLGTVLDTTQHAGFGFLIGFLAILAVPVPGLGGPFGLAVAFLGAQLVVGRQYPWLPGLLRRRRVSLRTRRWLAEKLARATGWMERLIKPRWPVLFRKGVWKLVGFGLLVQGLGLALPLPIPGSNMIFIAPIVVYALGLLEDDGLLVALGHAATLVNIALTLLLWDGIARALSAVLSHLA
jgi:hypothetical protein